MKTESLKTRCWVNTFGLQLQDQEIPERNTFWWQEQNGPICRNSWESFFNGSCKFRCLFMMVEHFIPHLSVLSPISRQECSLLFSSGMWSVRVSGFYTEKQEMQDRTGQLFKFMYSDRYIFTPKFQKPEHLGVTEIYHSQFHPQSQKTTWTSTDVSVLIRFWWSKNTNKAEWFYICKSELFSGKY